MSGKLCEENKVMLHKRWSLSNSNVRGCKYFLILRNILEHESFMSEGIWEHNPSRKLDLNALWYFYVLFIGDMTHHTWKALFYEQVGEQNLSAQWLIKKYYFQRKKDAKYFISTESKSFCLSSQNSIDQESLRKHTMTGKTRKANKLK